MTGRRLAIALVAVGVACSAVALFLLWSTWDAPTGEASWGFRGFGEMNGIGFTLIGAIVVFRRPSSVIGWLLLVDGVLWSVISVPLEYSVYAVVGRPVPLPGGVFAAWLGSWMWTINVGIYPILLVLFPDGRLSTPARRAVVAAAVAMTALFAIGFAVRPGPLQIAAFLDNPFTPLPDAALGIIGGLALVIVFPTAMAAAGLLVQRFRASRGIERQQLKWLAYGAVPVVILGPMSSFVPGKPFQIVTSLFQLWLPGAIAIAVLRYHLYDIDVLINRTLVYGALSATLVATYAAFVILLQSALRPFTGGSELAVAASTLATLALVQPFRRRIQEAVDQRFYRRRYDAVRLLDRFSERMRDEVDLDAVRTDLLDAVGRAVEPANASLWLRETSRS